MRVREEKGEVERENEGEQIRFDLRAGEFFYRRPVAFLEAVEPYPTGPPI